MILNWRLCGILNEWLNEMRISNGKRTLTALFSYNIHPPSEHMPASMAINAIIIEEYSRTLTWWDNYYLSCVFSENYFRKKNIYQRDMKKTRTLLLLHTNKKGFFDLIVPRGTRTMAVAPISTGCSANSVWKRTGILCTTTKWMRMCVILPFTSV